MKTYCLELTSRKQGYNEKLNTLREYLQAYILRIMHDEGFFRFAVFVGGTALRFLYDLPRFSEELDFSLKDKGTLDFAALMKKVDNELKLAGYEASVSRDTQKTVNNAWVKFPGLMYEAGISALKLQNFSIKIEVDTNPPEGAILKTDIVNKYFPLSFLSYDTASLFAGKLHAILTRKYTKGRDLFDLGWYLSKWKGLSPNIHLLRNALTQTKWVGTLPTENTWRELIYETIANVEWNKAKEDVLNFLENPKDLEIFSQENVLALVRAGALEPKRG